MMFVNVDVMQRARATNHSPQAIGAAYAAYARDQLAFDMLLRQGDGVLKSLRVSRARVERVKRAQVMFG